MFLLANDTISGQEGKAIATIEGQVVDLFFVKTLEATFNKKKSELRTLGKKSTQHKSSGWSGTGNMTLYYISSVFRQMAVRFAKTGRDVYFNVTVVNDDPGSSIGKQTMVLYNCNLDSTILARLDTEADVLEDSVEFTFDDIDLLDAFGNPVPLA